ncbi:MAG: DUF4336 domain-containing protein [Roseovarius sp.]
MAGTGYEPLCTLKPLDEGIWLIDGPPVQRGRLPYPTRATIVRLASGGLWVHSPVTLSSALREELAALGPVEHLVAPNADHQSCMPPWRKAYPEARVWAPEGAGLEGARALKPDRAQGAWMGQMEQIVVRAGPKLLEAAFFHKGSRTLILADLFEAHETEHYAPWQRPFFWVAGTDSESRHMRPSLRWSLKSADKTALAKDVEVLIGWKPRRIIISHGKWVRSDAGSALEYTFRKVLRPYRWEVAYEQHQAQGRDEDNR